MGWRDGYSVLQEAGGHRAITGRRRHGSHEGQTRLEVRLYIRTKFLPALCDAAEAG